MKKSPPEDLARRLTTLLDKGQGKTQAECARYCGVSTAAVSRWFKSGNISLENLQQAAAFFGVAFEWLAFGEGQKAVSDTVRAYVPGEDVPPEGFVEIPFYDFVLSAGPGSVPGWEECEESTPTWQPVSLLQANHTTADRCKMAKVSGDSMEPTLLNGDAALWIAEVDSRPGCVQIIDGKIYVIAIDGEFRIKRLRKIKGGLIVDSDNEAYSPERYIGDECDRINIFGRVIRIIRDF